MDRTTDELILPHTLIGGPKVSSFYKQLKLSESGEWQNGFIPTETWHQIWKMETTSKARPLCVDYKLLLGDTCKPPRTRDDDESLVLVLL